MTEADHKAKPTNPQRDSTLQEAPERRHSDGDGCEWGSCSAEPYWREVAEELESDCDPDPNPDGASADDPDA